MASRRITSIIVAHVLMLCWAVAAADGAPQYNIIALDVLPGGLDSLAFGLNDVGQVVGDSRKDTSGNVGQSRPVVWDYSGTPHELWSEQQFGGSGGNLADINNAGQVVGRYGSGSGIVQPTPGVLPGRAFVWSADSGRIDLSLDPFGFSMAAAINEHGQVAGTSEILDPVTFELVGIHPFLWDATSGIRDLGTLGGGAAFAADINALGQVVGYSEDAEGYTHAFVWDEANGMRELPSIAGGGSRATAINDLGQVLGGESGVGAFIWDAINGMQTIPVGGYALNNRGQVVGGAVGGLAIWDRTNGARFLADLIPTDTGWQLEIPFAINDAGDIVGYGLLNGKIRGPEPGSSQLCLFAIAFTAVLGRHRRVACGRAIGQPSN